MAQRLALVVLVLTLAAARGARAQPHTYLTGQIRDPSDAAVPGAEIGVINTETGFRREARSRSDGGYAVVSLEPGVYKITVRREGFRTLVRLGVRLDVGKPARVDFTLPLGSMQETITVEGAPAGPPAADASIGTLVESGQIQRLPLNGRGLISLLELAPGTIVTPATRGEAGQFSTAGQRPNTNYFTVDGVSANTGVSAGGVPSQSTGGSLPQLTALGSLHSLLSLEATGEFRIQTASATAEFGRLPGAHVVLNSRSGSNDVHGSVFGALRHEVLEANDWFANRHGDGRAPTRLQNFGGSLGGPVRRNRTFFFLAYEGMRVRQPYAWQSAVPSLAARSSAPEWALPLVNLFPAPNGAELESGLAEWTARHSRPSRFDAGSVRLDHALTQRITLFGRYHEVPSRSQFGGGQISHVSIGSRSVTFGVNARLRPGAVVDLRMNYSTADVTSVWVPSDGSAASDCDMEPVLNYLLKRTGACEYVYRLSIAGIGRVVIGEEGYQRQNQFHLAPAMTLVRGGHQMRFGGESVRLQPSRRDSRRGLGIIAESVSDLLSGRNLWTALSDPIARDGDLKEVGAFFQDTWRISRRLTASLGLRWEFTPAPELRSSAETGSDLAYPLQDQTAIWRRTYTNFAPRLGAAYRLSASGQTVLRAGWGVYYDSSFSIATDLVNGGPLNLTQYNSAAHAPFSTLLSYGFVPGLRLPRVRQWSAGVEQGAGNAHLLSLAFVASSGERLLRRELGGQYNTEVLRLALATNNGSSHYRGLQAQYRLRPRRGWDALVSYSWSHSIDDSSTDSVLHWTGSGLTAASDRGSSDFDVRHALTAAFGYETPLRLPSSWLRSWRVDGIFRARSGFPINVLGADYAMGLRFANAFRPNRVAGQPLWISDPSAPGGRRLNAAAFLPAPDQVQGNLGRNAITGFGMSQFDLALGRDFRLDERRSIQFRVEAFNALNHPSFADPYPYLSSPLFGRSPSLLNLMLGTGSPGSGMAPLFQSGGARSVQATLRFRF